MISYGHKANYSYLLTYGMCVKSNDYNAVGFLLDFNLLEIKHNKLKAELLNEPNLMLKNILFHQEFENFEEGNLQFMSVIRFYLYDGDEENLRNYINKDDTKKIQIKFNAHKRSYEKKVIEYLLENVNIKLGKFSSTDNNYSESYIENWGVSDGMKIFNFSLQPLKNIVFSSVLIYKK